MSKFNLLVANSEIVTLKEVSVWDETVLFGSLVA